MKISHNNDEVDGLDNPVQGFLNSSAEIQESS